MTAVIVVADLKGGSGKTTSAVFIAHGLQAWHRRVVLVDADGQQSAVEWAARCPQRWPLPAVELTMPTRMRQLWGVIDTDRFDTVVIDTPPIENDAGGVVAEALRHATAVIVPLAPNTIELHRVSATWDVLDRHAPGVRAAVLLNRVVTNSKAAREAREALTDVGREVMEAEVPSRQAYAQAFLSPIPPGDVPYARVVEEIIGWGAV